MAEGKTEPEKPTKMADESQKKPTRFGFYRRYYHVKDRRRALTSSIVTLLILASITALIVWLVYRPYNDPKFRVISVNVYQLNATYAPAPSLSTNMQFTVITRNSNRRTSFIYDQLSALVTYQNQPITRIVNLPPLHHGTKSTVAVSPVLGGLNVPVANEVVNGLMSDESNYGAVSLSLVMFGKLRYRGGAFTTGHYGVFVRCDLIVGIRQGFVGQVPLLGDSGYCIVDV